MMYDVISTSYTHTGITLHELACVHVVGGWVGGWCFIMCHTIEII